MQSSEYKVIPAPAHGEKAKGARSTEERLALALTNAINAEAREGWEYLRSESLPTEERSGLTKRRTVYVNMLVFRRAVPTAAPALPPPAPATKPLSLRALTGFGRGEKLPEGAPKLPPIVADAPEGEAPKLGPATSQDGTVPADKDS